MRWMPKMDFSCVDNMIKEAANNISSTSQLFSNTAQSIAQKNNEAVQKNAAEIFDTVKEAVSAKDMEQLVSCQQNYLRSATENNINNAKDILHMASKSSMELLENMRKNYSEQAKGSSGKK